MALKQFVDEHPDCQVVKPDIVTPSLLVGFPSLGIFVAALGLVGGIVDGRALAIIGWLAMAAVLILPARHYAKHLREVWSLHRAGRASFAVTDDHLLLVDAAGNAVVVALDRVIGLELKGEEARLRTDSDLQGVVYTVMFQLFDQDVPGPSADAFFEALAPRLRASTPAATIVRHDPSEGALIA